MASSKPKTWLLIPYGLLSIVGIIAVLFLAGEWLDEHWLWISMIILVPVALLENMKSGHSAMTVMFWKVVWTLSSFFVAGIFIGYVIGNGTSWTIPWYYFLAIGLILMIEMANMYTLLKSVKREFGAFQ